MLRRLGLVILRHVGLIFVLIPALAGAWFSTELEPIKDWVFGPIYIRWAQEKNKQERTYTFVFHNSGQEAAELEVRYRKMPKMVISDFAASTFEEGPYNSFASALSHLDSRKFEEYSLGRLMDPHLPFPSLIVLENELRRGARRKVDER